MKTDKFYSDITKSLLVIELDMSHRLATLIFEEKYVN